MIEVEFEFCAMDLSHAIYTRYQTDPLILANFVGGEKFKLFGRRGESLDKSLVETADEPTHTTSPQFSHR